MSHLSSRSRPGTSISGKRISTDTSPTSGLQRVLGTPSLILFGLAYMLPLTVFTTYGIVTQLTGGRVATAYIITLAAMIFTARSYARMSVALPYAGSAYVYSQRSFGPRIGFLTGWALLLDYLFLPMLAYLVIGIYLGAAFPAVPQWVFIVASLLIVTVLNLLGIVSVARANVILIATQFVFIVTFFALTVAARAGTELSLTAPFTGDGTVDGVSALFSGAAILCLSFLGFDSVSTLAEEARDPKKSIPRAIISVTIAAGLLFIAIAFVAQIAYPDNQFADVDSAALDVTRAVGGEFLTTFFTAAYVAGCFGSALTSQASVGRILFAMGRDGALPSFLSKLSERRSVPYGAILTVAVVSFAALIIDLTLLSEMISFGALIAFSVVNLTVVKHYFINEKRRGANGWIGYLILPLIGFGLTVWLWTNLSSLAFTAGLSWLAIGVIIMAIVTRGFRKAPPMLNLDE